MNTSLVITCYPPKLRVKNSQLSIPERRKHLESNTSDFESNIPLPSHVKSITSTSNPFVKHCLKLRHSSSYRHSHGSVLIVGSTPIRFFFLTLLCFLEIFLGSSSIMITFKKIWRNRMVSAILLFVLNLFGFWENRVIKEKKLNGHFEFL